MQIYINKIWGHDLSTFLGYKTLLSDIRVNEREATDFSKVTIIERKVLTFNLHLI